jgi:hypothetical protein
MRIIRSRSRSQRALSTGSLALVAAVLVGACNLFGVAPTPREHFIVPAPPAPTAAPTQKKPTAAIDAFVKNATSGTWSYRVAFKGSFAGAADLGVVEGRMEVSGTDFATTMKFDFSKDYPGIPKLAVSTRAIKNKAWLKPFDGGWKAISGYDATQSNVPFTPVKTAADVKFLQTEEFDGKTVHRISIASAVILHPRTIPGNLEKEKIRMTTMELLIDDKGRPVRGKWSLEGQGRVGPSGGQLQEITFDLVISFTRIGTKVTIKRP